MIKFDSDLLESVQYLQTIYMVGRGGGVSSCPHYTNVCQISRL